MEKREMDTLSAMSQYEALEDARAAWIFFNDSKNDQRPTEIRRLAEFKAHTTPEGQRTLYEEIDVWKFEASQEADRLKLFGPRTQFLSCAMCGTLFQNVFSPFYFKPFKRGRDGSFSGAAAAAACCSESCSARFEKWLEHLKKEKEE